MEEADPINLIWPKIDEIPSERLFGEVRKVIQWQWTELIPGLTEDQQWVKDPKNGWISCQEDAASDPFGLAGRLHVRLFPLTSGCIVGQAHQDKPVPHEACKYEEPEKQVAGYFKPFIKKDEEGWSWKVYPSDPNKKVGVNLHNGGIEANPDSQETDPALRNKALDCDGWATLIN